MANTYVNKAGNKINKDSYDKLSAQLKSRYTLVKVKEVAIPIEAKPKKEVKND